MRWIILLANFLSGRINNSLVSLNTRMKRLEKKMTHNEQIIENAAQTITEAAENIGAGIQALKDKITELEGVGIEAEDLSQELTALDNAVGQLKIIGDALKPGAPGTPAPGEPVDHTIGIDAGPITHDPNPVPDPLAGETGPTDAGTPTEVAAPGTGGNDETTPTTPVAEDAQQEANPTLGPSDDGATDVEEPETDESGPTTDEPPVTDPEFAPTDPATDPAPPVSDDPEEDGGVDEDEDDED